jgi:hypothetical protein
LSSSFTKQLAIADINLTLAFIKELHFFQIDVTLVWKIHACSLLRFVWIGRSHNMKIVVGILIVLRMHVPKVRSVAHLSKRDARNTMGTRGTLE